MKSIAIQILFVFFTAIGLLDVAFAENKKPFAPNVDMETGAIGVPEDYTLWPTLGTWTHAKVDGELLTSTNIMWSTPNQKLLRTTKRRGDFRTGPCWSKNSSMPRPCL